MSMIANHDHQSFIIGSVVIAKVSVSNEGS